MWKAAYDAEMERNELLREQLQRLEIDASAEMPEAELTRGVNIALCPMRMRRDLSLCSLVSVPERLHDAPTSSHCHHTHVECIACISDKPQHYVGNCLGRHVRGPQGATWGKPEFLRGVHDRLARQLHKAGCMQRGASSLHGSKLTACMGDGDCCF